MEQVRKPFQGVLNIVYFNWHYFAVSIGLLSILLFIANYFDSQARIFINSLVLLAFIAIFISLAVSFYVYDLSKLYTLDWLDFENSNFELKIININAGFDETSILLEKKFPNSEIQAYDFYNSEKHTEISIKRARKAYPPYPNTTQIETTKIPLEDDSIDKIFLILSAHEIRNSLERTLFFSELRRVLKKSGQMILTEHLRDNPNFFAYNIGAFHFHSKESWLENIRNAKLSISKEFKVTPFITTFILEKNGNSS